LGDDHVDIISSASTLNLNDTQVTSQDVVSDVTAAGTTTFTDPINVISSSVISKQEASSLYPVRDQTISDFLAKPALVESVQWNTSQVVNTEICGSTVRFDLLSIPLWTEKLKGFNFMRATAVYRVVINATPFHAGCLKFGFVPFTGTTVTLPNESVTWRFKARASVSTLPGPFIDARDSTAIIKIPYVSTTDYTTLEQTDGPDWGQYTLRIMSPLSTGATSENTISVSVYLHFEDVELAAPLHPQMSSSKKSYTKAKKFASSVGGLAKKEIADSEAEIMAGGGTISRSLLAAGKAISTLADVPLLSAYAGPTSWALRGASTVASWFGYCKPAIATPSSYVSRLNQPNMSNATGADTAPTLALFHDNSISVKPGFGMDDIDEMNFDHIKRIPMLFDNFNWADTALPGAVLASFSVRPSDLRQRVSSSTPGGPQYYDFLAPFAYLSTFFMTYRGSIDMHFRVVKTDFHSGKLSFHFVPAQTATTPGINDQQYLLRDIVDIKDKSEVTLRIPYLQYQKYIGVDDRLGTLYVTVVNELRAPESCARQVDVLVSTSAGEDFEYAIPGQDNNGGNYQNPLLPQMGGPAETDVDQTAVAEPIGNYPSMPDTLEPSCHAIGEKFVSVRQLLLRYTSLSFNLAAPKYTTDQTFFFYPFTVALPKVSTLTTFEPVCTLDALSRLAHGYAFMRGSMRVMVMPANANSQIRISNNSSLSKFSGRNVFRTAINYSDQIGETYNFGEAKYGTTHSSAEQYFDTSISAVSVRVPYYCENHSTAILPSNDDKIPVDVWNPYSSVLVNDSQAVDNFTVIRIKRAVGEDFSLGYFLGFPPVFDNSYVS
jgi:hypothetical protein